MKKDRVPLSPRAAVLGLLFLAAVWLRLSGITWGLPGTYNSDEPHIVNTALAYAGTFPRPYDFKYPALWPTVLFFCYGLYFLIWSCFGLCHRVIEFVGLFGWNPGGFYLIGRLLAAALTIAGTLLVARFEFLWRGRKWPWAALCLAFTPVLIEAAHSCKPDCMMFFWACLAWISGIELYREGTRRAHLLCGAFIGLAASTQYTAVPLAFILPAAHFFAAKKSKKSRLFEGIGAAALAFFITSPFTALDFPRFWADMKDFAALARARPFNPAAMRGRVALNYWEFAGPGSIAGGLAILGLLRLIWKERKLAPVFLIPLAFQWLTVASYPDGGWTRYLLAAFPGLALLTAEAFDWVETARRPLLTILVAMLALVPGFLRGSFTDAFMRLPDTRPLASDWIKANVPQGSALLLDLPHASPTVPMTKDEVEDLEAKTSASGSPRTRLYRGMAQTHPGGGYHLYRIKRQAAEMYSLPGQVERSQADYPMIDVRPGLDMARAMRIDYVVTSDWGASYVRAPELRTFFEELYAQARLIKDFIPAPGVSEGPVLRVFKLSR